MHGDVPICNANTTNSKNASHPRHERRRSNLLARVHQKKRTRKKTPKAVHHDEKVKPHANLTDENHAFLPTTRNTQNTRSLTSDAKIHKLIQELNELKDKLLDFLSRSTKHGEHKQRNYGEQKKDTNGQQRRTAKHAPARGSSPTRRGAKTSKKCIILCQD